MGIYTFKEWLSFEEAAAWLSDSTGDSYDGNSMLRLALKGRLPVHYWPTDQAEIVLFRIKHNSPSFAPMVEGFLNLDHVSFEPVCLIDGPVPIRQFRFFYPSAQNTEASGLVGLSASMNEPGILGCYRIGEDDQPRSMIQGEYEVLIHLDDIETMREGLPMPAARSHDLILGTVSSIGGLLETFSLARSTADWNDYPDSDLPLPKPTSEPESRSEPLLRALGLAAHLIADLGRQLDVHEQIATKQKRYTKGSSPNVSRISEALAKTAKELHLDGHNFKGAGFQKLLTKALRDLQ